MTEQMRCLSCNQALRGPRFTKVWNKLLICTACFAMAEKAEREIKVALQRAEAQSMQWLQQYVLQGGLLKGGSGLELPGLGKVAVPTSVPE